MFSAPNYCDSVSLINYNYLFSLKVGNKGAVITFDSKMKPSFITFKEVPHPVNKNY